MVKDNFEKLLNRLATVLDLLDFSESSKVELRYELLESTLQYAVAKMASGNSDLIEKIGKLGTGDSLGAKDLVQFVENNLSGDDEERFIDFFEGRLNEYVETVVKTLDENKKDLVLKAWKVD